MLRLPLPSVEHAFSAADLESIALDMEFVPMPNVETVPTANETEEPLTADNIRIVEQALPSDEQLSDGAQGDEGQAPPEEEVVAADALPLPTAGPVLRVVECLPEFPGGMTAFVRWLTDNLRYPPSAQKQKVEGTVLVSFIVNADGSISDCKVVGAGTTGQAQPESAPTDSRLEREALRVIGMMPAWTPGKDKGEPCRTMLVLPIVFAL